MQLFWFLPTHGDSRYLGTSHGARTVSHAYLKQVAQAATLDRLSNGRLLISVVTRGDPDEQRGDGSFLTHAERYEVTNEFLKIWRGVSSGETVNFSGKHLKVENAKTLDLPVQQPYPPLWFGGTSDAAIDLAGERVDVYLTCGEPPADVAEKTAKARASAARHGRTLRIGIRLHAIVRETSQAAGCPPRQCLPHRAPAPPRSARDIVPRPKVLRREGTEA